MATLTKAYLHDATTGLPGNLPGAANISLGASPSVTATGASTNRKADAQIGTNQASAALTTLANTSLQHNWFRRWIIGPLAAQTLSVQTVTLRLAASEANAASDMFESGRWFLRAWRPSTQTVVGTWASVTSLITEPGTSQTAIVAAATSVSLAVQEGDILVLELFSSNTQSMASAYTNTVFYDGTTEGSTTSNAAHLEFSTGITLLDPRFEQFAYRGYDDDADIPDATALAAQNTPWTQAEGEKFRLRIGVEEDAGVGSSPTTFDLQYRKNSGTWTAITSTSSDVQAVASDVGTYAEADPIDTGDLVLTGHSGTTAMIGVKKEADASVEYGGTTEFLSERTEFEFCLTLVAADVANGDTIDFRLVRNGSTVLDSYAQTPQLTVGGGANTYQKAGSLVTDTALAGADAATVGRAGSVVTTTRSSAADAATVGRAGSTTSRALLSGGRIREFPGKAGATTTRGLLSGVPAKEKTAAGALLTRAILSAADADEFAELGALITDTLLAGADVREAVESGAVRASALLAGADVPEYAETGFVASRALLGGQDVSTYSELGSLLTQAILAGVAVEEAGAQGKAGAITSRAMLSGADVAERTETGFMATRAILSGLDVPEYAEAGALIADTILSGADRSERAETGALVARAFLSGADTATLNRVASLMTRAILSGVYSKGLDKTGSLASGSRLSGIATQEFVETGSLLAGTFGSGVNALVVTKTGYVYTGTEIYGGDVYVASKTGAILGAANLSALDSVERARAGAILTQAILSGVWQMLSGYFMTGLEPHLLTGAAVEQGKLVGAGPEDAVLVATTVEQAKLTNVEG